MKNKLTDASLLKRVIAYLIDIAIISIIIVLPLKSKLESIKDISLSGLAEMNFKMIFTGFEIAILTILYFSLLEWKFGQTIGKMFMKIRVISEDKKSNFWNYLVRNLSKFSTILLLIDSIMVLLKRENKRFLDKIAHTRVVEV